MRNVKQVWSHSGGGKSATVAIISSKHTKPMVLYGPLLVRVGGACSTISCWREQM